MKAQFGITETILIIGVLVASGITVYQLLSFYNVQTQIAKEEVVVIFAKDLEAIIDKAIATSGDVVFVYYPPLVRYYVKIENNTVFVHDKNLNKTASFSKQMPEIVSNFFEDSKKITIAKMENKIFIMGRCLENGEACSFSLACCSGFCWGQKDKYTCNQNCAPNGEYAPDSLACCSKYLNSSRQCDKPPLCPAESVCLGSTDSGLWIDSQGRVCCPSDKPICSNKHCCPESKPKWCNNPKNGEARCMDENEYSNDCKTTKIFKIVTVAINYDDMSSYLTRAMDRMERFLSVSPFRECPDSITIEYLNLNCHCTDLDFTCPSEAIECVQNSGVTDFDLVAAFNDDPICNGYATPPYPFVICFGGLPDDLDKYCISHEIGHQLKLCDEYKKSVWEGENLRFTTFTFPYYSESGPPYSGCGNPYPLNTGVGPPNSCVNDCSIDNSPCQVGTCGEKMSVAGPPYETCIMGGGANIKNPLTCSGMAGYPNKFDSNAYNFIKTKLKEAGYCE
ncbi:MAG: hypothetical protein QXS48_01570 [Candidatus Aenigmatarchaeota archaeon]